VYKLDKYIIGKYLKTFFFTVILITMVALVIDFSDRADKFINLDIPLKRILIDYYLMFIPWINGLLWPLFSLIAVIFFTSRLAKNTEVVAMLSAGISYKRFLVPYMMAAGIISSLLWVGSNYIIPRSNKIKTKFENTYIAKHKERTLGHDIHFYVGPSEKIYLRSYHRRDTTGRTFRFERFVDGELKYALKASKISLKEEPNTWQLNDYEKRMFDGSKESLLMAKGETMDTVLNLRPQDFIINDKDMLAMTTPELREAVGRRMERGLGNLTKYLLEINKRTADPIAVFILTLIGVSVASRKSRGGVGMNLAVGVVLGALFVVMSKFSETFSYNLNLPPVLGIWLPNIIFVFVAYYLFTKAQK